MTEAELAEGRRLLELARGVSADYLGDIDAATKWLYEHADTLLARREEIAREAVRSFALEVLACTQYGKDQQFIYRSDVDRLCEARGVNL